MSNKDLHALFLHTLKDIYFAESTIVKTLPKLAKVASDNSLKSAFETHLKQTKTHVDRLEKIFEIIDEDVEAEPCDAIKGILKEGDEVAQTFKGGPALDQALIAAAQAVEHYEIARYGALRVWSEELGLNNAAKLLAETLQEEKDTDQLLTKIAESNVDVATTG